jgi:hypothetical protein
MLVDVVVDTDVLAHAENPASGRQEDSRNFITAMRACGTLLCLDDEFTGDEATSRGIAAEYLARLTPGSQGLTLIQELVEIGRIRVVSARVSTAQNRAIAQIIGDRTDRKFAKAAINSDEKVVVSHDRGFQAPTARKALAKRLGIGVLDAGACCRELEGAA